VRIQAAGALVLRYGLVLVIGWIGVMKLVGFKDILLVRMPVPQ
jgi:hypothetical protein